MTCAEDSYLLLQKYTLKKSQNPLDNCHQAYYYIAKEY
ncbi:hypothetical protein DGWBC_1781 [Dehalogenimonas sp. WBC-2]|nr:hypothetical protein DGWBC_1781 [Dehalogenimonas sp. WBC-2]